MGNNNTYRNNGNNFPINQNQNNHNGNNGGGKKNTVLQSLTQEALRNLDNAEQVKPF